MDLQDGARAVAGAQGEEGLGARARAGRDRAHRAARRCDQRGLRARLRARARGGARGRRGARQRRRPAADRDPDHGEGVLQRRRVADDLGLSTAQGLRAQGGRAGGGQGEGRRRGRPGQDQRPGRAGRLAELQRALRHDQQPVRPGPHARRILGRLVCGARRGLRRAVARLGHRRGAARARRPTPWCRRAATPRRRCRHCRTRAISPWSAR
jgi:hypothetical protein